MTDPITVDGPLIRALRLAANHTARDLADLIGVGQQIIWRLEASDVKMLTALTGEQLVALSRALGARVDALVGTVRQRPPEPSDDARQLLALLHGQGREVKQSLLAQTLGWDLARLDQARASLDAQLAPRELDRPADPDGLADPTARHARRSQQGLDAATARVMHGVTYPPGGTARFPDEG
jgi:transcriptional regulator with XRE-family HTH domain